MACESERYVALGGLVSVRDDRRGGWLDYMESLKHLYSLYRASFEANPGRDACNNFFPALRLAIDAANGIIFMRRESYATIAAMTDIAHIPITLFLSKSAKQCPIC